ncbi:MAG: hypothetical protein ABEK16_01405 [Candidatus Nanohalobium sp.]
MSLDQNQGHEELAELVENLPFDWELEYQHDWLKSESPSEVELKSGYDLEKAGNRIDLEDETISLFFGACREDWNEHLNNNGGEIVSENNLYLTHSFETASGYAGTATKERYGEPKLEKSIILEVDVPLDNIEDVSNKPFHSDKRDKDRAIESGQFIYGCRGVEGAVGSSYPSNWISAGYEPDEFYDGSIQDSKIIEL